MENENQNLNSGIQTPENTNPTPIEFPTMPEAPSAPAVETPVIEQPVVEAPVMPEAPVMDAPAPAEPVAPVVETPVIETPVEPTPMPESPLMPEAPAPVVETPAEPTLAEALNQEPASPSMPEVNPAPTPEVAPMPAAPAMEPAAPMPESPAAPTLDPNINLVETSAPVEEEIVYEKPKKKGKFVILLVVMFLLALIAGGVFAYFKIIKISPSSMYTKLVNTYTTSTENLMKQSIDTSKSFVQTGVVSIDSNMQGLSDLKNFSIKYNINNDVNKKEMLSSIDLLNEGNPFLSGLIYVNNKNVYLKSEDLSKDVLKLATITNDELINLDDYVYIVNSFNKALNKSLSKASFSNSLTDVTVNGKKTKAIDNVMVINDKNLANILSTILTEIKNDSKLIEIIANNTMTSKEEVQAMLNQNIDLSQINNFEVKVHLYTKLISNDLLKLTVNLDNEKILDIEKNNNIYNFDLVGIAKGKVSKTGDNITANIDINEFTVEVISNMANTSDESNLKLTVNLKKGNEYFGLIFNAKTNYALNGLEAFDITNAKDINALTEKEQNRISKKLDKALKETPLYNLFSAQDEEYNEDEFVVPAECEYAKCDESCVEEQCTCTYTDTSFKENEVVCPNPNFDFEIDTEDQD